MSSGESHHQLATTGLPVGMQVLARHHADELLFDVTLAAERTRPNPAPFEARTGWPGLIRAASWPRRPDAAPGAGIGPEAYPVNRGAMTRTGIGIGCQAGFGSSTVGSLVTLVGLVPFAFMT